MNETGYEEMKKIHDYFESIMKLKVPHLAPIYQVSLIGNRNKLSLKIIEGGYSSTLFDILQHAGSFKPTLAIQYIRIVSETLVCLHDQNEFHGALDLSSVGIDSKNDLWLFHLYKAFLYSRFYLILTI
jgi:hypothetical protein